MVLASNTKHSIFGWCGNNAIHHQSTRPQMASFGLQLPIRVFPLRVKFFGGFSMLSYFNSVLFYFDCWVKFFHSVNYHLAILWINLHAVTFAFQLLGGNHCCTASREWFKYQIPFQRKVLNHFTRKLNWIRCAVFGCFSRNL